MTRRRCLAEQSKAPGHDYLFILFKPGTDAVKRPAKRGVLAAAAGPGRRRPRQVFQGGGWIRIVQPSQPRIGAVSLAGRNPAGRQLDPSSYVLTGRGGAGRGRAGAGGRRAPRLADQRQQQHVAAAAPRRAGCCAPAWVTWALFGLLSSTSNTNFDQ